MLRKLTFFVLALIIAVPNVFAEGDAWDLGGEVRVRSELDGKDMNDATNFDNFANMRTRFHVGKSIDGKLNLYIQLQDTRLFGVEGNTLNSIFNVDLHQAYAMLLNPLSIPLMLQAGRFEVSYGTQRFFGAVGWSNIGRSFDGVRFQNIGELGLDVFALTEHQATPNDTETKSVYGAWFQTKVGDGNDFHLFAYHEADREMTFNDDDERINALSRTTLGSTYIGNYGTLGTILEAAYQFGTGGSSETSIGAYLVALYLQYIQQAYNFGIGVDLVSGNDNESDKYEAFNQQYGTNHKFYGFMDYFLTIPENTNNAGLTDIYAKFNLTPQQSKFAIAFALHMFLSGVAIPIWDAEESKSNDETAFGNEIDITVNYNFLPGTTITWGGSMFLPGAIKKAWYGEDMGLWTYIMLTANIK